MKTSLTLLFTAFTLCVLSQSPLLDSLRFELDNQKDVQEIARTCNNIGEVCLSINPDSALYYTNKAVQLYKESDFKEEMALGYLIMGKASMNKGSLHNSLSYYDSASKIYLKLNDYSQIVHSYNRRGLCYQLMGQYGLSQAVLDSALNYAIIGADTSKIINSYLFLSSLKQHEKKYEASLDYLYKALEYIEFIDDANERITAYINIANLHSTQDEEDKALVKLYIAAALCETTKGKETQLNYCYQSIATIYQRMNNSRKAIEFSLKALDYIDFIQINENIVETYSTLSLSYSRLNDFENAITYGIMALELAQELDLPELAADCSHNMDTIYHKAELQKQKNTEEHKNKRIAWQKILNIAIGAIAILLLFILVLVWINTRLKP